MCRSRAQVRRCGSEADLAAHTLVGARWPALGCEEAAALRCVSAAAAAAAAQLSAALGAPAHERRTLSGWSAEHLADAAAMLRIHVGRVLAVPAKSRSYHVKMNIFRLPKTSKQEAFCKAPT